MTQLVVVLGSPRTHQQWLVERLEALPGEVHVDLVTRVVPSDELREACRTVVVLEHAVPSTESVRRYREEVAEAAGPATPAGPVERGALGRVRHGLGWRARRVKFAARRKVAPQRARVSTLTSSRSMARRVLGDPKLESMLATGDVVCAADNIATLTVWQLGQQHSEPAVVQGIPAAETAVRRAATS